MIEQQPNIKLIGRNLSQPNYLNVTDAVFFKTVHADHRNLRDEEITSYEIGYYSMIPQLKLELDIKVYKEHLTHLISDRSEERRVGKECRTRWTPEHKK